jgi:hypothetical protein
MNKNNFNIIDRQNLLLLCTVISYNIKLIFYIDDIKITILYFNLDVNLFEVF